MRQSNNGVVSMKNTAIGQTAGRSFVVMTGWTVCDPSLFPCVVVGWVVAEVGPVPSIVDSWAPLECRVCLLLIQSMQA